MPYEQIGSFLPQEFQSYYLFIMIGLALFMLLISKLISRLLLKTFENLRLIVEWFNLYHLEKDPHWTRNNSKPTMKEKNSFKSTLKTKR